MHFNLSKSLVAIIFLVNTTGVIRYYFQWGDPASSPGYEAVPIIFFVYWNVLAALFFVIIALKIKRVNKYFIVGYLYLLATSVIVWLSSESFYVQGSARSFILNGFLFILISSNAKFLDISQLNRCVELLGICIIGFLFLQIFRVYFFEIYPSHSHPGHLIRYGSIYDDSLVLSIMSPMFSGYFLKKYQGAVSTVVICLLSLCLSFSSGSLTGMLIMVIYLSWCIRNRFGLLFVYLSALIVSIIVMMNYLRDIFIFKSESISSHVGGWADVKSLTIPSFLGVLPTDHYPEPGYLSILLNFGFFVDLGFILLMGYLFRVCIILLRDQSTDHELRGFVGAVEGLLVSVSIANLNFPVVIYPPIYFMLAVMSGTMFYHYSSRVVVGKVKLFSQN